MLLEEYTANLYLLTGMKIEEVGYIFIFFEMGIMKRHKTQ